MARNIPETNILEHYWVLTAGTVKGHLVVTHIKGHTPLNGHTGLVVTGGQLVVTEGQIRGHTPPDS